jgi:hypothetical protein
MIRLPICSPRILTQATLKALGNHCKVLRGESKWLRSVSFKDDPGSSDGSPEVGTRGSGCSQPVGTEVAGTRGREKGKLRRFPSGLFPKSLRSPLFFAKTFQP